MFTTSRSLLGSSIYYNYIHVENFGYSITSTWVSLIWVALSQAKSQVFRLYENIAELVLETLATSRLCFTNCLHLTDLTPLACVLMLIKTWHVRFIVLPLTNFWQQRLWICPQSLPNPLSLSRYSPLTCRSSLFGCVPFSTGDGCAAQASTAAGSAAHNFPELHQAHSGRCLLWNQAAATSNSSSDTTANPTIPAPGPASSSHAFGQRWPFHGQRDASHAVWQRVPTPTPIYEGNPTCAKNGQGSCTQERQR